MGNRISNTTEYPIVTPARNDITISTDISDTSTDAGGETVNFTIGAILDTEQTNANITGGSISGITDLAIADGGTGSSTASAARGALGLAIGSDVQAWDADLDTWATKAAPTGAVIGTTDTQTLTNKTINPGSNTIDGDVLDITFTPSNYTPDTTPAEASDVDDLAAHLQGIDIALGAAGGGGLVFIATSDLSSDATADFTAFDGTKYDAYVFVFQNVTPASDGVQLRVRTSSDSGVNYDDALGDYKYVGTNASYLPASGGDVGDIDGGVSGNLKVAGPHLTQKTAILSDFVYGANSSEIFFTSASETGLGLGGFRQSADAVNAIRFYFSAGNIASGTITMYGMVNA